MRKTAYGNASWQRRISSIKHNREFAKNIDRKEKAARLDWENKNMLRRLTGTTSVYNRKEWEKDFQHGRNLIEHSSITYRMNKLAKKTKRGKKKNGKKAKQKKCKFKVSTKIQHLPSYDSAKDPYCKSFYASGKFKKVLEKQRKLEERERRAKQRERDAKIPIWRKRDMKK